MKKVFLFISLCFALLSSCSDFLKEEDKDKVIPRTVDHFLQIMHREAFITNKMNYLTEFMTDDIEERARTSSKDKNVYKNLYTWQRNLELDANGDNANVNVSWELAYRLILICNYVMENIDDAIGEENEKDFVRGEAYFVRARSYFELVNLYAKHYDVETAATEPGVPRHLGTGVEDTYTRSSVAVIYDLIEADLKEAIRQFSNSGLKKSLWHPNAETAMLLLSRMYLYKSDWDNCIDYATRVIDANGGRLWNLKEHREGTFVNTTNPEILHTYGDRSSLCGDSGETAVPSIYESSTGAVTYGVSTDLLRTFLTGDLRAGKYMKVVSGTSVPTKWLNAFTDMGAFTYRVSEAYLNRAEAYAFKNMDAEAYADVVKVVENRVEDMANVGNIAESGVELKRFIFDERRREFCFEGQRWYDLKRTKLFAKQINHKFTEVNNTGTTMGTEIYMLAPNDPNYIYPIPQNELNVNNVIQQNERVDKLPIKEDY